MTDHLPILRRVGWVLIVLGMLDIGALIYCIVNDISYASSLNVFAVAAGIFLLRGSLRAVRYVVWSCAFALSASLLLIAVLPALYPLDYLVLIFRSHPWIAIIDTLFAMGLLVTFLWVYRQLRLPPVIEAEVAAHHRGAAPRSAFITAGAIMILFAAVSYQALNGEVAQQAKRLAQKQCGRDYKYVVSGVQRVDDHFVVEVTAYRRDDMKRVTIDLQSLVLSLTGDG